LTGGGISVANGAAFAVQLNIQDRSGTLNTTTGLLENGNPIPSGSSIGVGPGTGLSVVGSTLFIEGCSSNINGDNYVFHFTAGATPISSSITVTVIAESTFTVSTITIPVTIT
jgi:hypothetical protein